MKQAKVAEILLKGPVSPKKERFSEISYHLVAKSHCQTWVVKGSQALSKSHSCADKSP